MAVPAPRTISFAVRGPIARGDLPGLCDRVCALLGESAAEVALCDVDGVPADAVTVDALARLQLAAGRSGCRVRLRNASDELRELVAFMGLRDVLADLPMSSRAQPGPSFAYPIRREDAMSRKLFLNLAVQDLDRSVRFFTELGFAFDPRYTDEQATCMVVGEDAFVMLLAEDRFRDFTKKGLADPSAQTEAIVAVSVDSREQVDELADRALAAGAAPANDPIELDSMYGRSFQDPDGHQWELFWMDGSPG